MPRKRDFIIISNRLPVRRVKKAGRTSWETSPGGLVSALRPVIQERKSTWIGWTGDSGKAPDPFETSGVFNHPVALSRKEIEGFYEGFSNRTLWPLYHDAVRPPEFRRRWWWPYVEVNQRYAEHAAKLISDRGAVWVHDYHLQLVPQMLRKHCPRARIGFFLHIPFPPEELFARLPWRTAILQGLLGADVIGFQTKLGARNFLNLVRQYIPNATVKRDRVEHDGRTSRVSAFPISVDIAAIRDIARKDETRRRAQEYRRRLGQSRRIVLGVDRLDYTKGIDVRLQAFGEALASGELSVEDTTFVQVAVPSRERVEEYKDLRSHIERLVGEINGEHAKLGLTAVHYLHRGLPFDQLVGLYCAADVLLVTPLRDGMNLVAKEYVSSRIDRAGVLVLSEFAGAAHELRSALLVNPHDIDALAMTIGRALELPASEQRRRMNAMQRAVERNDIHHWANAFLQTLDDA